MPYKTFDGHWEQNKCLIKNSATKEWKEMAESGNDLPLGYEKERMIKNGVQKRWNGMMKESGGDLAFIKAALENAPFEGKVQYEGRMQMLKMIEEKMDAMEEEMDAEEEKMKLLMSPTLPGEWVCGDWVVHESEFPSLPTTTLKKISTKTLKKIVEEPTESES